ncbi:nitroreductase family protein [Tatumella sp. OPLPL6]|uniref:nitroreductase family protein n=1 Tax=Tatumella sp. OPLPL6 TaxID=1928657 RepID=UPI000C19FF10|nr:nitroreductase family protein [Tatumella sp. OPLPL6]PIJ43146.1 NADPH-dependent oxidoreductase [Tatumella sp. OPLPL6]
MSTSQDKLATLLTERYGKSQQIPENIIATPQVEAMLSHKSVRAFLPDPLPEGALETMVAAAQSASSSSNLHQWSVVAITDRVLKQKISDTIARTVPTNHIPYLEEAPVLLLWIADLSRGAKITREKGEEPLVFDYLDSFLMASVDATLAAQNAALAAESMGLGIVFMGMIRNASREVAEIVNLPQHSFATFGMVVGKPDSSRTSSIRPRPEQAVVLHYNRYDQERYRNHIENYEKVFLDFRQAQSMKPKIWKDSVYQSATSLEYMGGREYLRETVQDRGFKLK